MNYKYYSFSANRSSEDAEKVYAQRIEDATYIYNKHHQSFAPRNCPACDSGRSTRKDTFHGMYGIDQCDVCGSSFVNPAPSIDALADYYENCLCNRQLSKIIKARYDSNDFINDERVQLILKVVEQILQSKGADRTLKILEVGCNNGAFLSKLRQALEAAYAGEKFELYGVDIDPVAINNPVDEQLNLFHGFAEEIAKEHQNTYDIVLHFELIEHLINPKLFVASVHEMLGSNGKMIFTTPNFLGLDNQALSYNGMRYLAHAIFPPMHINAFSTKNMSHFLISNHFAVEEIATPGKLDVDMLCQCVDYLQDELFKDITALDEQTRALLQQLAVRMNVSSHMQCIATKIDQRNF